MSKRVSDDRERNEGLVKGAPPRVATASRSQIEWRLFDPEQLVAPDHAARAMWTLVEQLDLSRYYDAIEARIGGSGRPAIDPKILVCLWLYATSDGVGSAREIEELTTKHDAYRWICGGVSVNHHTLSDFRVGDGAALDDLFTQVLGVMIKKDLITLYRTSQDGMRVRASAGAASFRRKKSLDNCRAEARRQIAYVKRLSDEDPEMSARQRAARERAARERLDRIKRAIAELPRVQATSKKPPDQVRASTTDAQARVMKMGDGGFRPAYNVQLATDVDSRAIVGVSVTTAGGDAAQMKPMLEQIERRTGALPDEHLVDGGFVNLDAFVDAAERGVGVFAPVPAPRKEGVDPHAPKPGEHGAVTEWRQRMATDEAKETYKQRAATAETVNADLRSKQDLTQFLVRGLNKVTCVAIWGALTYNVLLLSRLA
jgi:transposase